MGVDHGLCDRTPSIQPAKASITSRQDLGIVAPAFGRDVEGMICILQELQRRARLEGTYRGWSSSRSASASRVPWQEQHRHADIEQMVPPVG